jgi:hypothetical protein
VPLAVLAPDGVTLSRVVVPFWRPQATADRAGGG